MRILIALHESKAVIGFALLAIATLIWALFFQTEVGYALIAQTLWFIGGILIYSWFKKERKNKLRLAAILAVTGQIYMWWLSEAIFATSEWNMSKVYDVLFIAICWSTSGILILNDKIKYGFKPRMNKSEQLIREFFSDSDKEQVLSKQRHRCATCNRILGVVDFDHIDGNKSNNHISNCQALCPNCHAIKTRKRNLGPI